MKNKKLQQKNHSTFFLIPVRKKSLPSTSNTGMEPRKSCSTFNTEFNKSNNILWTKVKKQSICTYHSELILVKLSTYWLTLILTKVGSLRRWVVREEDKGFLNPDTKERGDKEGEIILEYVRQSSQLIAHLEVIRPLEHLLAWNCISNYCFHSLI